MGFETKLECNGFKLHSPPAQSNGFKCPSPAASPSKDGATGLQRASSGPSMRRSVSAISLDREAFVLPRCIPSPEKRGATDDSAMPTVSNFEELFQNKQLSHIFFGDLGDIMD